MTIFTDRTVLITGATGGIAREVALEFYEEGANLALTDLSQDALDEFVHEAGFSPDRVWACAADMTSRDAVLHIAHTSSERFGGLDFLVPAAGVFLEGRLETLDAETWRTTLAVNLEAILHLLQATANHLADGGAIVLVTSLAAHRGAPEHLAYAASKGALVSLMKSLARSEAPRLRVNAVAPGLIATRMTERHREAGGQTTLEDTPLQRVGHPREVATVIKFLCSEDASFMTGQVLHVNGGVALVG